MKSENTFFYLACLGWLAGLIVHVATLFGYAPGGWVWALHIGIFVVWFPCVLRLQREGLLMNPKRDSHFSRRSFFSIHPMFKLAPRWMRVIAITCGIYALINFMWFVLHLKISDTGESPLTVRGFSGHWIAFYGAAAAGLYPRSANRKSEIS